MYLTFVPISFLSKLKGENLAYVSEKNSLHVNHVNEAPKSVNIEKIVANNIKNKFIYTAVQDDSSPGKAIQQHAKNLSDIEFLEYDCIGISWDFYFFDKKLIFIVNGNYIYPTGLNNKVIFLHRHH